MIVKFIYYFWAIFLLIVPIFVAIVIFVILKPKFLILNKSSRKSIFITIFIGFTVGCVLFAWNFYDSFKLMFAASEMEIDEDNRLFSYNRNELQQPENDLLQKEEGSNPVEEGNFEVLKLQYSDNFITTVAETYVYIENERSNDLCDLKGEVIAQNTENGREYTVDQLFNKKLLIPYMQDGKEVFFYGQFNEKEHWDGTCIFNIYGYSEDLDSNILETIMEAEYDDGVLISYRKVIRSTTTQNNNVWSIFYGEIIYKNGEVDYAKGETWNYFRVNEYLIGFDISNVNVKDIIYIDEFEKTLKNFSFIEGYYCGNISNGYYNDDTGNAYMIKYTEVGFIRTIYVGRFKNGLPDDQSGNAWQIVFDDYENVNRYFYYKGKFSNNKRQGKVTIDDYVTQEEINKIINGMQFNCELNWYDERNIQENDIIS